MAAVGYSLVKLLLFVAKKCFMVRINLYLFMFDYIVIASSVKSLVPRG